MDALEGKRIVLGVTGGIAVYKACDLVSRLVKRGAQVRVVLTENACRFVPPLTFEALSGNRAAVDGFAEGNEITHIALARWADVMTIAPATANCLAKAAMGLGDDLLSATLLAVTSPILAAPAMNSAMWRNAATQANVKLLSQRGWRFVGPASGRLACGDSDVGRMSEPEEIAEALDALLTIRDDLKGRRILVTAGPTVEPIDPVRFITNRSSGKMGFAIAEAAAARGADVRLISGPVQLETPKGVQRTSIGTSAELCAAVLDQAEWADTVIQAAAPADFTPETTAKQKIKKTEGGMVLQLKNTTDIAAELGRRKRPGQVLVAFAAETQALEENARAKLAKKNADLIVANDVSQQDAGFAVDTNRITLITTNRTEALPLMSKREAADAILDRVVELLAE